MKTIKTAGWKKKAPILVRDDDFYNPTDEDGVMSNYDQEMSEHYRPARGEDFRDHEMDDRDVERIDTLAEEAAIEQEDIRDRLNIIKEKMPVFFENYIGDDVDTHDPRMQKTIDEAYGLALGIKK